MYGVVVSLVEFALSYQSTVHCGLFFFGFGYFIVCGIVSFGCDFLLIFSLQNKLARMASDSEHSQSAQGSAASSSEGEGTQREQRARGQGVASRRRVSQRDQGDSGIDVDLLITCIQERGPLWDSRDPRHMDQVVLRRLWVEVAKSLWDGFESASSSDKSNFVKKLRTRWRSMKDRFNKGLRNEEEQARSGAAAAKSVPYKYYRALQFLRPVLVRRQTHSSTLERARPSGADLHESPSDPSQPSHSDSRLAPPSGEPAAGPSGVPLPEASGAPSFGNSRQRQRASDRPTMPEFLHLSTCKKNLESASAFTFKRIQFQALYQK
ncbi:uncharacterized protein LOC143767824 [Ranitomeya variabilis]|uniref:uncharacterized protein LOC143767824 n=1 Tax=Ranitomeya variabilis TaxID=490064 RepID=UPI004057C56F